MKRIYTLVLLVISITMIGCNNYASFNSNAKGIVYLEKNNDNSYTIKHSINDTIVSAWKIDHPVYAFDYGDLDNNGENEICVGVIKKTKYDTIVRKRLFIYKLYNERLIRPRWLGSHVGFNLENFYVCRDSVPAVVITTETKNDSIVQLQYHLGGFGLQFDKYIK